MSLRQSGAQLPAIDPNVLDAVVQREARNDQPGRSSAGTQFPNIRHPRATAGVHQLQGDPGALMQASLL